MIAVFDVSDINFAFNAELIQWANDQSIDPNVTYRIEIHDRTWARVFQYAQRDGGPYTDPKTGVIAMRNPQWVLITALPEGIPLD